MIKSSQEIERKFLAFDADLRDIDLNLCDIRSVYLDPNKLSEVGSTISSDLNLLAKKDIELRVSHRQIDGNDSYWYTVKVGKPGIVRAEAEAQIDKASYEDLSKNFGISVLDKKRFSFSYLRRTFELDVFIDQELMILEVELKNPTDLVALPPFINLEKEVTGDPKYYSFNLAETLGK